jgi:hypothetical protein
VAEYADFEPERIKHLELIQAVITRLAGNSFLIKGWALTLTAAFLGFGVTQDDATLAAAGVLPIIVFWLLDTYYLRAERLFRALYDEVRKGKIEAFVMAATAEHFIGKPPRKEASWKGAFGSKTLLGFYLPLAAATALVEIVICNG